MCHLCNITYTYVTNYKHIIKCSRMADADANVQTLSGRTLKVWSRSGSTSVGSEASRKHTQWHPYQSAQIAKTNKYIYIHTKIQTYDKIYQNISDYIRHKYNKAKQIAAGGTPADKAGLGPSTGIRLDCSYIFSMFFYIF